MVVRVQEGVHRGPVHPHQLRDPVVEEDHYGRPGGKRAEGEEGGAEEGVVREEGSAEEGEEGPEEAGHGGGWGGGVGRVGEGGERRRWVHRSGGAF